MDSYYTAQYSETPFVRCPTNASLCVNANALCLSQRQHQQIDAACQGIRESYGEICRSVCRGEMEEVEVEEEEEKTGGYSLVRCRGTRR